MPPVMPQPLPLPATPWMPVASPPTSTTESPDMNAREGDINFAGHSWNLATGGLKTLTAKRELPPGRERRTNATEKWLETEVAVRSYTFALVVVACIVVMLISGGIVLFMMLQP